MGDGSSLARRVGTVARWPVGIGLVLWRYLWRTLPLHRTEEAGSDADLPPPLPADLDGPDVQGVTDGTGPLLRRSWSVRIEGSALTPEQLIERITANPNRVMAVEVAVFRKTRGDPGPVSRGDEYLVRMPGPWDGPLRVVDRGPTSFRFATLRGHFEAGQIEWRARRDGDALRFEVESWARNGDRLSALLFDWLPLGKELQLHIWTHVCQRAAELAGGRPRDGVHIRTRRLDELPATEGR